MYPSRAHYPKEVTIRGNEWAVRFCKFVPGGHKSWIGYCDKHERTIWIVRRLGPKRTMRVFVHEVAHAFEAEYGLKIPHKLIQKLEWPVVNYLLENFVA